MIRLSISRADFLRLTEAEVIAKAHHYDEIAITDDVGCLWLTLRPRTIGHNLYYDLTWPSDKQEVLTIEQALERGEFQ